MIHSFGSNYPKWQELHHCDKQKYENHIQWFQSKIFRRPIFPDTIPWLHHLNFGSVQKVFLWIHLLCRNDATLLKKFFGLQRPSNISHLKKSELNSFINNSHDNFFAKKSTELSFRKIHIGRNHVHLTVGLGFITQHLWLGNFGKCNQGLHARTLWLHNLKSSVTVPFS